MVTRSHKILKTLHPNLKLREEFSRELGISRILAQILANRNIQRVEDADKFLKASLKDLHDPFLFEDMHKSVEIIKSASSRKEKFLVYGDYDVDGITALALLKNTLSEMGVEAAHYLPHRIKEGYGLCKNIVNIARENKAKILITVDCGISNHEEIKELRRHNIEVIVTDHHEPADAILPPASGIINPKTRGSRYGFRDLAGVGVAFKLCQALSNKMRLGDLDLVSLGTIADVVPLTGENRIIVKEGLAQLSSTKRPGLIALIESSGFKKKKFNSTLVSFIIGPRINASGRMDTAEVSLKLLMSEDMAEARRLSAVVEAHNRQRQKIESKIMDEAEDLISKDVNFKEHKVIVIAKENWHHGVLGVVASKLADRFYRPAIVISLGEDLCKGSGRSIKNFHLFQALSECSKFLNNFGGHSHAAGLVITRDSIEDFKKSINRLAKDKLLLEDLIPSVDIDLEVGLSELSEELALELEQLEPFGTANPEPLFYTRSLKLKGEPQLLSRDTLKFWVSDGKTTFQAIGFGMGSFRDSLESSASFDLIYTLKIDNWQEESSVILEAKDIFFK
ncbi:MAG TPA: single-stranded-DNA-specific exonuclease RecJ [Candidatus Margulisiibacteriota bacterium]|nr:single-stranded-DNA-specific exonuclease RecJ [Candidatus Margulisiibacteriota bacterium]